jgi:uncharacterized Zn finger protein
MNEPRWSEPFLSLLESLRMPGVFQQGRRLSRTGHVRGLAISASLASAQVLDDNGFSCRTKVAMRALSDGHWGRVERALAGHGGHVASLLSGTVPAALPEVLASLGLSLYPGELSDIALACDCPDWRIPCVHLAATCYALAESFDRDPLSLVAWRGRDREELLANVRALRLEVAVSTSETLATPAEPSRDFWAAGPRLALPPSVAVSETVRRPDAVLDELDALGLSVGRHEVVDLLRPAYRALPW